MRVFELEADGVTEVRCTCARCEDVTTIPLYTLRRLVPHLWSMTLEETGLSLRCERCDSSGLALSEIRPVTA